MNLHDVKFKPWRNGSAASSTGYGLCVSKKYAQLFPRDWRSVVVEVVYKNDSEELEFNLNETFCTTCPDLKNNKTKEWLKKSGDLDWNGRKPEFKTQYLTKNKFRIFLDGVGV